MKSYLQELENNEAILLMYLADELPAQDRAEVEQMLACDAGLRAELDSLRGDQESLFAAMETLDAADHLPIPRSAALRNASRLMRQWVERQREAVPVPVAAQRPPFAWRQMTFAAAALLLIGVYMWAAYHPVDSTRQPLDQPIADRLNPPSSAVKLTSDAKLALLSNSLEDSYSASDESSNVHLAEVADLVPGPLSDADLSGDGSHLDDKPNVTGEP